MLNQCILCLLTALHIVIAIHQPKLYADEPFNASIFERDNLIAWCIVPFDAAKRAPQARAEMLNHLGLKHFAYDYRAEHIQTFDEEILQLKEHNINLTAWWFPTTLNEEAKSILATFKKHRVKTQLWVMGGGDAAMSKEAEEKFIESELKRLKPIVAAAAEIDCQVGLYNHGGWFGDPRNQVKLIKRLDLPNVGIVYNMHHAHDQVNDLKSILQEIKPYLLAINLNGMKRNGDREGAKILPIGEGELDVQVIQTIGQSGYQGPIGILNHTDKDAKARLEDNLAGLSWIVAQIHEQPKAKPVWKSYP